jgi:hypothetical protein
MGRVAKVMGLRSRNEPKRTERSLRIGFLHCISERHRQEEDYPQRKGGSGWHRARVGKGGEKEANGFQGSQAVTENVTATLKGRGGE